MRWILVSLGLEGAFPILSMTKALYYRLKSKRQAVLSLTSIRH